MSNFFSPPAHLYAVTYMTEISLIVTSNNQSHSFHNFLTQYEIIEDNLRKNRKNNAGS